MPRCCGNRWNKVGPKLLFIEGGDGWKDINFILITLSTLHFLILESFTLNPSTHKKINQWQKKCRSTEANNTELGTYVTMRGKACLGRQATRPVMMAPVKCHHVLSYTKDFIVYFIFLIRKNRKKLVEIAGSVLGMLNCKIKELPLFRKYEENCSYLLPFLSHT